MHQLVGLLQFPLLLDGIFNPHHCNLQTLVHLKAVGLHWRAGLIVAMPMVRK